MAKSREYVSHYPDRYWTTGLHDAGIVGVESFEFPFDYNKFFTYGQTPFHSFKAKKQRVAFATLCFFVCSIFLNRLHFLLFCVII